MKYYIVVTDTNSRQYVFEILNDGLNIQINDDIYLITKEDPGLEIFFEIFKQKECFLISGKSLFNTNHLVGVEFRCLEE